jgi:putative ABC transport system permease protein
MEFFDNLNDLTRVGLSIVFVLAAMGVSRWQKADLEKELGMATIRSFIQLILIGFALELIFQQDSPIWTLAMLGVMTVIAGRTAAVRAKSTPQAHAIALLSIGGGSALTMSVLIGLRIFDFTPRDIIPIGGMVIGNAMTTATLAITRLTDDFYDQRNIIESMLALGADSRRASLKQFQRTLRSAMIPIIDTTKTVGLIKLPGAMTGMILAGASPLQAVQLQMIVMYMLVGASTFTGLIAAYLTYRQFFTPAYQLKVFSAG